MLSKEKLNKLYLHKRRSSEEIAKIFKCSTHKINYWLEKYKIPKRSISEAIYIKHNPSGDPFKIKNPENPEQAFLFGLGLGLYWGEGTKSNKSSVRLGNTDPRLIKKFIEFLEKLYGIKRKKLRFGLQIFSDTSPKKALNFWQKTLRAPPAQFQKVIVTPARSIGTYRYKTKHGVLTINYGNTKLRNILVQEIEKFS